MNGGSSSSQSKGDTSDTPSGETGTGTGALLRSLDASSRRTVFSRQQGHSGDQGERSESQVSDTTVASKQPGAASEGIIAVNTAIATDSSGIQAADAAIANDFSGLEAAKSAMQSNLKQSASDPEAFHETMKKSFGGSYDKAKAEVIRQQVLNNDFSWMPDIKVVDESVLQDQSGAQGEGAGLGAYSKDTDTIYISAQLLKSDPEKATQILTEEVGHGLDTRLNTSDAAGR